MGENQGNDPTPPLTLPDHGKVWRWLGGVKPPICRHCQQEPGIANYAGRVVGWGCLRVLVSQEREGDSDEDEGNDEGTGGVREPRRPMPSGGGLEVEVGVEV